MSSERTRPVRDFDRDEVGPVLVPVVVGGGTRFLPDGVRLDLELVEERRFEKGAVHVRYRVRRQPRLA